MSIAALLLLAIAQTPSEPRVPPWRSPLGLPPLAPPSTPAEEAWATLGARLFFDPVLSRDRTVSCASCHRPEHGFADTRARSTGILAQETERNTPSLENRVLGRHFSWDGRATTLEEQVLLPIENPREMALPLEEALARLARESDYAEHFPASPDRAGLARALSAYVRRIVRGDSPVDRFQAGDFAALDDAERAGLWFFESRGGCWRCHAGANFSDEDFHNTGVGVRAGQAEPGRMAVSGEPEDRGRFKTPSLRGLAHTAPYMHDGSLATLESVVEFYRRGGEPNADLDPRLAPLEMSDADARNLTAFLQALSRSD